MTLFLKIALTLVVGAWTLVRGAEEAFGLWVRRATRQRDLDGLSWA